MNNRFREFIEHIIEDGGWEYDDGPSMTADAKGFLAEQDTLCQRLAEAEAREAKLRERLAAVSHLPESWREEAVGNGSHGLWISQCADELEAALSNTGPSLA